MAAAAPVSRGRGGGHGRKDWLREKLAGTGGHMTPWLGAIGGRLAGGAVAR